MRESQIAIIGGGVIGSAIARELSKYKIKTIVFEKGSDVASGTSKANSGVIHSGINSKPGSQKALFCVQGNQMFQKLSKELGFSLKWTGKYVIAKNEKEIKEIEKLKKTGIKNGVPALNIKDRQDIRKKEKNIKCKAGLWVPTAGIILPYEFTIALAENAAVNNVKFLLETKVLNIKKEKNSFKIITNNGVFQSDVIVNAAGMSCLDIVSMVEKPSLQLYPCRGEYLILDKKHHGLINSMIYPIPVEEHGVLGVHITPTIEGNILLGPSAEYIKDSDDKKNTKDMMNILLSEAKEIIPSLPTKGVISAYAGVRCKLASPEKGGMADFIVEESKKTPGMINLLGIESPGLTAAPAIAKKVMDIISQNLTLEFKKNFKPKRKKYIRFNEQSNTMKKRLLEKDKSWGKIICRCEHITEKEVINALENPLGSKCLSAVKYRCRAGMGRCQGGFCTQHIVSIMEQKFNIDILDIKLKSPKSKLFTGRTRGEKQ